MSGVKNIFNEQEEAALKAFKVFENKLFSEDQVAINYNKYLQLLKWRLKKGLFAKRTRFEQNNFINIYPESERKNKTENEALKIYGLDIVVKCSGQVSVELQYGNDSEQESQDNTRMSFPFEFEGAVSWNAEKNVYFISEIDGLRINTDDYYR